MSQHRQLAAILFTDIVGYTALMQENEHKAVELINRYDEVLNKFIFQHHGKVLNNYGDGSLCTFPSVSHAIDCAMELQKELQKDPVVPLRIGLHVGEVFFEGDKALGDGVNLASRVQSLGQANAILFSREVYDKVRNRPELKAVSLGNFQFKNVHEPIEVFALANNGLVVPKRNKMEGKLRKKSGMRRNLIIALSLAGLLAIGYGYWNFFIRKKFTGTERSIAVLPFVNVGNIKEKEYVSEGMTDDIITRLYKIAALRVIPRTTAMRYKSTTETLEKIAEELNVASILDGDIQILGNKLKINVRLTDVNTGNSIWSDRFDGDTSDLFAIQGKVAEAIAGHMNTTLTDKEKEGVTKRPTNDFEAWNQYSQGRHYMNTRSEASIIKALAFFSKAIELDPTYAQAYAGRADCYSALGYGSYVPPREAFLKAEVDVDKSISLDSMVAESHASKAYIEFYYYWRWAKAEMEFKKAIGLNPQYDITYDYYAYYLSAMERFPEAHTQIERAQKLDPISPIFTMDMGFTSYYDRKYDEAFKALEQSIQYNSKNPLAHVWLARIYQAQNKYPEAIAENLKALAANKTWIVPMAAIGYVYGITGKKAQADSILKEMFAIAASNHYVTPYAIALIYACLRNFDKTFEYLEKSYADRAHWLVWLKLDPRWDPIRKDKRYEVLVAKIGLPKTGALAAIR